MADYIERQAAIDAFNRIKNTLKNPETAHYDTLMFYEIEDVLEDVEPADVVPVRHGTWLPIVSYNNTYKCSECGRLLVDITDGLKMVAKNYPYCHCGAKMDAQGEET